MEPLKLLNLISNGETSQVQFKEKMPHHDSLAKEMIAMSNSKGGTILLGVKNATGDIVGIEPKDLSSTIGNIATNNIIPPIYITTKVISTDQDNQKKVLMIEVAEGNNKPYKTSKGEIYVKQASDKRRLTDNNEISRLFRQGGNLMADEMPVIDASLQDINEKEFREYFQKIHKTTIEEENLTYEKALQVKRVILNDKISLGGLLFFGKNPQSWKPYFCIKAISFFGNDIAGSNYRESIDMEGTIPQLFDRAMRFFENNLSYSQQEQNFNSTGELEVSRVALEELLQNALVHRDYFKNSPIRLMIFDNRIEIVSPGKLPNSLTVEEIKYGNPVVRNNLLVGYAINAMLYRGFGSGISRSLKEQPDIDFINDEKGEQFIVKIPRPKKISETRI